MRVIGKMTSNMERESKCGKKARNMKEITIWGESKERENIFGQMAPSTMAIGLIIELADTVYTFGKMEDAFMGNGRITTWRALGSITGEMAEVIRGNIIMIRSQGMANISGPMEGSMKVGGQRGSSMVLACTPIQRSRRLSMVSGRMGRDSSGLMSNTLSSSVSTPMTMLLCSQTNLVQTKCMLKLPSISPPSSS
jgi:hypothetical protein